MNLQCIVSIVTAEAAAWIVVFFTAAWEVISALRSTQTTTKRATYTPFLTLRPRRELPFEVQKIVMPC